MECSGSQRVAVESVAVGRPKRERAETDVAVVRRPVVVPVSRPPESPQRPAPEAGEDEADQRLDEADCGLGESDPRENKSESEGDDGKRVADPPRDADERAAIGPVVDERGDGGDVVGLERVAGDDGRAGDEHTEQCHTGFSWGPPISVLVAHEVV